MNIHPIWSICILVRSSLAYITYNNIYTTHLLPILLFISLGFFYKYLTGSNNEIQIANVFWHDSRYVHGFIYLLAFYYLSKSHNKMSSLLVILDILYSISYRIKNDK